MTINNFYHLSSPANGRWLVRMI